VTALAPGSLGVDEGAGRPMATHRLLGVVRGTRRADGDAAIDFNVTNFDSFLNASPE
jgi:hypothetical protein